MLARCRSLIALCFALCVATAPVAQTTFSLDTLFRQAAEREMGPDKDYAGAARLYDQAARQGHVSSMVRLGYLLQSGTGVKQDVSRAFELFMQAANAGDHNGQFMLAMSYLQGIGTPKDPAAARKLLLQPAGANHQYAQFLLGAMIESGEGGPRAEASARRWLDRAASGPDPKLAARAAQLRDKIDQSMLAPDNHAGVLVSAVLVMALAGAVLEGGGSGDSYSTSSSAPTFGSGSTLSPPPCRPVPMPMFGDASTPNGRALITPSPQMMMGGC